MSVSSIRAGLRARLCAAVVLLLYTVCGISIVSAQSFSVQKHASSLNHVKFMGTHLLTKGSSPGTLPPGFLISQGNDADVEIDVPGVSGNNSLARERAAGVPTPAGT